MIKARHRIIPYGYIIIVICQLFVGLNFTPKSDILFDAPIPLADDDTRGAARHQHVEVQVDNLKPEL